MQEEERQVDGGDLERAVHKETLREQPEHDLPELAGEEVRDIEQSTTGGLKLIGAMRMIFDNHELSVSTLRLPRREARALEALQTAVSGRSTRLGKFVFADDRSSLLEQALAALQPNLAGGDPALLAHMHEHIEALVANVTTLRHELSDLADAQDELIAARTSSDAATASETGDKPTSDPLDPEATRPATTLIGPEITPAPKPPSSLTGPELEATTKPSSTLGAPDSDEVPAPATTLGAPDELAPVPKKPWWKRPLG